MTDSTTSDGETEWLKRFAWKSAYASIPEPVRAELSKHIGLFLYNYYKARENYYYLCQLRKLGLNPSKSRIEANGLRLWWVYISQRYFTRYFARQR